MERVRWFAGCLTLTLLCALTGCGFLTSREREYVSNEDLLEEVATLSRFPVNPELFELTRVDARDDSITYQYRGVRFVGDHAWVVRFSEKSTEQDPVAVENLYTLLPVVGEKRSGFAPIGEGEEEIGGERLRFIRYRFDSPVRDAEGQPLPGTGILGSVRIDGAGGDLIYQIKLDNHGDREEVTWESLKPFLEAIRG